MKPIRILVKKPHTNEGTGYYRSIRPLSVMRDMFHDIDVQIVEETSEFEIQMCDVLFVLRPSGPENARAISDAKHWGKKVWVDYDDNLLDLPSDNQGFAYYQTPSVRKAIKGILEVADLVTVSTEELKRVFSEFSSKIHVVRNAIDPLSYCWEEKREKQHKHITMWRGTNTHQRDIMSFDKEIFHASIRNPNQLFTFFGYNPWFFEERINMSHFGNTDFPNYMKAIRAHAPRFSIVPLADHSFNRCKSNIASLEAAYAGAPSLVPNWPEWQIPGVIHYESPAEFGEKLNALIEGEYDTEKLGKEAWQYVVDNNLYLKAQERAALVRAL